MSTVTKIAGSACAILLLAAGTAFAEGAVDCSKGAIPAAPVAGTLNGVAFAPDSVTLDPVEQRGQGLGTFDFYLFHLTTKAGAGLDLTVITLPDKRPDGKTFRSGLYWDSPETATGSPEIQNWTITDRSTSSSVGFYQVTDASLQIVFGNRDGKALPAQIHFCVPSRNSEVGGSFTIPLQ
jgi:hypothetical protein